MNFFFAAGDAPFFFSEQLKNLSLLPDLWRGSEEMGISALPSLWIDYPFRVITYLLYKLGFSWFLIDKLWWLAAFIICFLGIYKLCKYLKISRSASLLGTIIYTTNTYILLLFDGGQLGVSLAYAVIPWVAYSLLSYFQKPKQLLLQTIKTGLLLSVLGFLDLRAAYVFCVFTAVLMIFLAIKKQLYVTKYILLIPVIILATNMFWILPTIVYKDSLQTSISQKTDITGLSFFSVADFSHALSLLHPNYPENLFGRVYFFKPEFLIIPLLGFSLFLQESPSSLSIFLGLIILLGAFLGKGVQEPLGMVYEWLYRHLPGFFLFRDPTKWYVLTALGYSIIIPQSVEYISKKIFKGLIIVVILFWVFSLRFVFLGKVTGNVSPPVITQDYQTLKELLIGDRSFGRTLWIPSVERFGYSSSLHPSLSSSYIFSESSPAGILREFEEDNGLANIKAAGISYILVPEDIEHKVFIDDYIYQEDLRNSIIAQLDDRKDIQKVKGFSKLGVYKIPETVNLFSLNHQPLYDATEIRNTWEISFPERGGNNLFTTLMAYDPNWRLKIDSKIYQPKETEKHLMSFNIDAGGEQIGNLYYLPNRLAAWGAILSGASFMICGICIIILRRK